MRTEYDGQLELLNKELITLGALCENAIADSAKALAQGNVPLAGSVPEQSAQIDQKEREIEGMCVKLLLRQQPVAGDLRVVSSALKMVTDMQRIGKQSADIAEIVTMEHISPTDGIYEIHAMADAVIQMVTDSVDAFVKKDVQLAKSVVTYDDVVDDFFNKVKKMLIARFPMPDSDSEPVIDLLMIAKYLERIGDHAVNIAKWVLFSLTGSKEADADKR